MYPPVQNVNNPNCLRDSHVLCEPTRSPTSEVAATSRTTPGT
jgi:hypothetical protein